ncbi:hypothetical protein [Streptomyces goshikiensis]|uniref:hypothetical protein n=1 Tax=Streptomyces goshikiensis TaxID=1942 RepID=UPI003712AAE5
MSVGNPGNLLDGPERAPRTSDGPELKRCDQCGRLGIRSFKALAVPGMKPITLCANKAACRKRWPKPATDEAA